jgi:hypothetical protein
MELKCLLMDLGMLCFDIGSAFPHAEEDTETYLRPPKEWKMFFDGSEDDVWILKRSLYGRRSAGANFRDKWEEVVRAYAKEANTTVMRGDIDPTIFTLPYLHLSVTCHIDDGRAIGPTEVLEDFKQFLLKRTLLRCSKIIGPCQAFEHVLAATELDVETLKKSKPVLTPGVKRDTRKDMRFH